MNLHESTSYKLYKFAELLDSCKRARLTGTRGAEEIYNLQIHDCLESLKFLPEVKNIIDVGSGGGLPGVVWAVMRPELQITLIDSVNKKCEAMQEIINSLEINNINIFCARSEDFAKIHREKFDLACARAVASAGVTAELLAPLVKISGKIITFKGEKVHDELNEVNNKWHKIGLSEPEIKFYGGDNNNKCLVIWEKISKCPNIFPRKAGQASIKKFWQ